MVELPATPACAATPVAMAGAASSTAPVVIAASAPAAPAVAMIFRSMMTSEVVDPDPPDHCLASTLKTSDGGMC